MQGDDIAVVPGAVVEDDVFERLLPGQDRREHDPVVVEPWLGAEHGHRIAVGIALDDLFEGPAAGHAVADDDQAFLGESFPGHWVSDPRSGGGIAPGGAPDALAAGEADE